MNAAGRTVVARVPATTANLGPGFDCLGMAFDLYNQITLGPSESGKLEITVSGRCATDDIARDEKNLVYRAAAQVFDLAGERVPPLRMHVEINTPLSRGLGSSASAIVGGMAAANAILEKPLDDNALLTAMCRMEGHPDNVVACARGGLTTSLMLESGVAYARYAPASNIRCVLLVPGYELSTARARAALPAKVTLHDAIFNLSRVPFVVERLVSGNLEGLSAFMDDRLHQPYRKGLIHSYDIIAGQAEDAGAKAVTLSGAGPTMLAIADETTACAVRDAMKRVLDVVGVQSEAMIVSPSLEGTTVRITD